MKSVLVWATVTAALIGCESQAKKPATSTQPLPSSEDVNATGMMEDGGMVQAGDAAIGNAAYDAPPPQGMSPDDAAPPQSENQPPAPEPQATPQQTREAEAAVDDVVTKFENLAEDVEHAAPRCDRVATAINNWSEAHRDDVESAAEKVVALPADDQQQILADFQERMHPVGQRIDTALGACKDDPEVVDALQGLGRP
ncbi:MAG TPA: hypothetical protein VFG83_19200 [Kofleriaceae bacterium]|nr:hypothetical protein [Kofleriaceae bacterium]